MICSSKPKFTMRFLAAAVVLVSLLPADGSEVDAASNTERIRKRRYYDPWNLSNRRNAISVYQASSQYRASPYTVTHPYYIPVYGNRGSLMFYPPQQLYVNPGVPKDNRPFGGGHYTPPKPSPHFQGDKYLPPTIENKFGLVDEDDTSAPVWGEVDLQTNPLSGGNNRESGPAPTRAPISRPQAPPLVHTLPNKSMTRPSTTTTTPAPSPRTTSSRATPSNCVWAIIACCNASTPNQWHQNCFERRGCPGPFWGGSPCSTEYSLAAIESARKYYNQ